MRDIKSQPIYRDDIDLLALVGRAMLFLKKYRWLFIGAISLGLLLGFLRYRSLPVLYKSRLILQSTLLSNQNNIQIVSTWNALLKSGEHVELGRLLNLDANILKQVHELKSDEIQKIFTPSNPNGFTIDAKVRDPQIFNELENGLVYGFDNNGYIREKLESKKHRLSQLITKTAFEIQRLDSVKNQMSDIMNGRQAGGSLIFDASGISRQLIDMNEKYLNYKEDLDFSSSVQIIQGFGHSKHRVNNSLIVWLILGVLPCIGIAYLVALLHSINIQLKQRERIVQNG